jgi:benzoyl-CoA reductase subunit C
MPIEKHRVGWTCSMVPEEVIFAAGLDPVRILKISERESHSSKIFPSNFCSLVKGYLDVLLDEQGEKLDGLIFTPSCNATEFLFDAVKDSGVVDYLYMLDAPRRRDNDGIHFFAEQLRLLASSLEDNFDSRVTRESLLNAIIFFNSIRENINIIRQARLQGHIFGRDFFSLVKAIATGNKKQALEEINAAREAIAGKTDTCGKKKILLIGTPLMDSKLIECIENAGGAVFLDDLCTSNTYMSCPVSTEGDLFFNLAYSYLQSRICTRMDCKLDRINQVKEVLDKYKPDGVIYNLSRFRVTDCYDSIALKEELFDEKRPPFLVIENENTGQVNLTTITKIEAFMELLQEKHGG